MAKIGIIAALDCEIEMFIRDFGAKQTQSEHIYKGEYMGHDIYLTLCGVGKVNAAICAQRLFDFASLDAIINSGVAGGISKDLKVCDITVSSELTYHDFKPLDLLDKYAPGSSRFIADKNLVKYAQNAASELIKEGENFNLITGVIVSGDMFVEDKDYKKYLCEEFNAVSTEMEGAAVAHTALLNKVPFVVIRAISDNADDNANMSFDAMSKIAAERASKLVKKMIEQI